MTPQQLIDLNGYGQARKRIIKMGKWRHTTALEVLYDISEDDCTSKVNGMINEAIALLEKLED